MIYFEIVVELFPHEMIIYYLIEPKSPSRLTFKKGTILSLMNITFKKLELCDQYGLVLLDLAW